MSDEIKVSVIMGVYNQWDQRKLQQAVQSILTQTLRELEFIIYDDGSHPEVHRCITELSQLDERIIVIGSEINHGLAFSLNACIDTARGKYIARMDADDISLPRRLQVQYDFMEAHPEYAWCGCNAELFDENGTWGSRRMPKEPAEADYLRFSPYIHPTIMYRSEIFLQEQKYHVSRDTLRCEDYEIFMRYQQAGYRGCNLQEILFRYREDAASYQKRTLKHRISEMKIRYRNFAAMGMLFPKGWLYVLRPVVGWFVPNGLLAAVKKREAEPVESRTEVRTIEVRKPDESKNRVLQTNLTQ